MNEIPVSDELADLVFTYLDHAIESIRGGGSLIPFCVVDAGAEGQTLSRFVADALEDGAEEARTHVRGITNANRAILVYDGFVTVDGERSDAILVEAQGRGTSECVIFAQRYRPRRGLRSLRAVGNPAYLGPGSALF